MSCFVRPKPLLSSIKWLLSFLQVSNRSIIVGLRLALRKRATTKRFRTAASEQFKHWKAQKAPRRRALSQLASKQYARPAVYALYDGKFPVYVGETRNLKQRIEHLLESEMWSRFNVDTIRIWDVAQELDQFALRSFLVTTQQPLLNSDFLVLDATDG